MDRNSIIGFALIVVLVVTYVLYTRQQESQYNEQKKAESIAYAKAHPVPVADLSKQAQKPSSVAHTDSLNDSIRRAMPPAYNGKAEILKAENKKLALEFSTKGAYPVSAEIKAYKTYWQTPLYMFKGQGNMLSAILPVNNGSVSTADLYFTPSVQDEPDGGKIIDFTADLGSGKKVDIIYTLPADDYMIQCNIHLAGMPASSLNLNWETIALHTEKDINNERLNSQVYYHFNNDDNDYYTIRGDDTKNLSDIRWMGFRKQYFSTILYAKDGFSKVNITSSTAMKDTNLAAKNAELFEVAMKPGNDETVALNWYIGPNDYKTYTKYKLGFDEMVPLGYGIMAFVKYVNKFLLIPIFYFLSSFITNYGIIIMLMTLFIRIILSFFTYKSYLSAAKMRVLKPEIDALRAQYSDDQQKFGMEQMKLYRSAGVNPLGGCLPTLFQIPILFALYYMFPSLTEFRQKQFLWAHDLSTYDSILDFHFNIPFYGDHVSLFTLLMTGTSLWLALYNKNMTTQDPNNPALKYMPFIFPFLLLGVFNKMAAALTFYYAFSNVISIAMQFLIQKYFIDEKAIHAKMQENKTKPATPSKWAQKLEEIQKAQQQKTKQLPPKK